MRLAVCVLAVVVLAGCEPASWVERRVDTERCRERGGTLVVDGSVSGEDFNVVERKPLCVRLDSTSTIPLTPRGKP